MSQSFEEHRESKGTKERENSKSLIKTFCTFGIIYYETFNFSTKSGLKNSSISIIT